MAIAFKQGIEILGKIRHSQMRFRLTTKTQVEIFALRSAISDEALSVIQYTIEPQIPAADKLKP